MPLPARQFRAAGPSILVLLLTLSSLTRASARIAAQTPNRIPTQLPIPSTKGSSTKGSGTQPTPAPGTPPVQSGDSHSATGSQSSSAASGKPSQLSPLAPAAPPPQAFARPRIGLALGGGGALALSEVGVLQWFEQNRIPVDLIAGTSMGCMVSALYSTGLTPQQLSTVMNDRVFTSVFTFSNAYTSRSFRRREDARDLPNGISIGLRHGVSFRNAVLADQGLNAFLDRQFLRYDDQTDFNSLPIPLRCVSTDLNDAQPVTFARGSLPDAVRASVALPGIFQPFEMNGHEYVDGGVLQNLPTPALRAMQPDVVLAVSLPLAPVAGGELNSVLGVLQRSFSVGIEGAERNQRKLADIVLMPDITGFSASDYLKTVDLAKRGYAAAEAHRAQLLAYALSPADWSAYLAHRAALRRGPPAPVLRVRVNAPNPSATLAVQRLFAPLVNQPVDTARIETLLDQLRADGRYEADYTVGYESAPHNPPPPNPAKAQQTQSQQTQIEQTQTPPQQPPAPSSSSSPVPAKAPPLASQTSPLHPLPSPADPSTPNPAASSPSASNQATTDPSTSNPSTPVLADQPGAPGLAATQPVTPQSLADLSARPIILVTLAEKKTGPPFLLLGANLEAQTTAPTRATVEAILLDQDLGGYGAELRSNFKLGYLTSLSTEYFRPLDFLGASNRTIFFAPRASLLRQPFPIYSGLTRLSERQLQRTAVGADLGYSNRRTQELRAGFDFAHLSWQPIIGGDLEPNYIGNAQRARLRYAIDTQDRALVPQFGFNLIAEAAFLFATPGSPNAPQLSGQGSYAHTFSLRNLLPSRDPGSRSTQRRDIFLIGGEAATMFQRNVAQPFRYTLGGPFRLSASAIDQYRATDYFLVEPGLLHRIAQLPAPLGQSLYLGGTYEFARIHAPGNPNLPGQDLTRQDLTRQDIFFGIIAETPLGVINFGPALGSNQERKLVFTLGKLF